MHWIVRRTNRLRAITLVLGSITLIGWASGCAHERQSYYPHGARTVTPDDRVILTKPKGTNPFEKPKPPTIGPGIEDLD